MPNTSLSAAVVVVVSMAASCPEDLALDVPVGEVTDDGDEVAWAQPEAVQLAHHQRVPRRAASL